MSSARLTNSFAAAVLGLAILIHACTAGAEVVAIVSARNPVPPMSKNQVLDIFLGKASRFPDGTQAVVLDQAEGSAARDEFYLKFAGKSPAQMNAHWSKVIFTGRGQPPREVADGLLVKKRVLEVPGTIGYVDQSLVDGSLKVVLAP